MYVPTSSRFGKDQSTHSRRVRIRYPSFTDFVEKAKVGGRSHHRFRFPINLDHHGRDRSGYSQWDF